MGILVLLTGAAGMAQQPPQPPQLPRPAAVQAPRQLPVTDAERRRLEEITARRTRGEVISPEDERFAEEMMARMNRTPRPAVAPQPMVGGMTSLERVLGGPGGKWWTRPEMAQKLGLTADQMKKMDDIFQQHRLRLIDLDAAVRKEEVIMEPLISAEQPDEAKIVAQIDKVAQARAELEKANARMLLGIRRLLTPDQWNRLKSDPVPLPKPVRR
jgi:Spy/CpxP family protein refolding chaperone